MHEFVQRKARFSKSNSHRKKHWRNRETAMEQFSNLNLAFNNSCKNSIDSVDYSQTNNASDKKLNHKCTQCKHKRKRSRGNSVSPNRTWRHSKDKSSISCKKSNDSVHLSLKSNRSDCKRRIACCSCNRKPRIPWRNLAWTRVKCNS